MPHNWPKQDIRYLPVPQNLRRLRLQNSLSHRLSRHYILHRRLYDCHHLPMPSRLIVLDRAPGNVGRQMHPDHSILRGPVHRGHFA